MARLGQEVEQLLNVRAWRKVLFVNEPAYQELTLEFIATFERRQGRDIWDDTHTIRFQLRGQEYHLSYTKLALFMGINERDYTLTEDYRNLLSSPPLGETQFARWRRLSNCGRPFRVSVTTISVFISPHFDSFMLCSVSLISVKITAQAIFLFLNFITC